MDESARNRGELASSPVHKRVEAVAQEGRGSGGQDGGTHKYTITHRHGGFKFFYDIALLLWNIFTFLHYIVELFMNMHLQGLFFIILLSFSS